MRNDRERGLTLIELLVAVALTALIAVMSWQAVDQSVTLTETAAQQRARLTALQRTAWLLERDLLQMAPRSIRDALGDTLPAFQLRDGVLEWTRVALADGPDGVPGLLRVGYRVRDGRLERLTWPVLDRGPGVEPRVTVLLEDVQRWSVSVYGLAELTNELGWHEDWMHLIRRPERIRIRLYLSARTQPVEWLFMGVPLNEQIQPVPGVQPHVLDPYELNGMTGP